MTNPRQARLSLGPVLFNWAPEKWRDFYFRIADEAPVDSVCVGEVVCSKRWPLYARHVPEVVARLEAAGKEVVHSTLAVIISERELRDLRETVASGFFIEANDLSAVSLLKGRPHAIGPFVNIYNEGTLQLLVKRGARRVCPPVELSARSLEILAAGTEAELEVQVFGRLPLAVSARCFHARSRGLHRDNCQYACEGDPDGMAVETLAGQPFLAVNGTQVLSYAYGNLAAELEALGRMGVGRFRLSPQDIDMVTVAGAFRDALDGREDPEAIEERLQKAVGGAPFCNGFFHGREGTGWRGPSLEAE